MASVAFPIGALQPATQDQGAPQQNENGGLRAVDTNRPNDAPRDTVTLTGTFPPAQAVQASDFVKIQEFSVFVVQGEGEEGANAAGNAGTAQANAQVAAQPAVQPAAQPANQAAISAQAAQAQANAGENNIAQVAPQDLPQNAGVNAAVFSTPQQELQQLDNTLRELGIDPQTISLFNRIGLLLFANDPAALQNLVNALQTVDQQLQQLGGLANGANQAAGAAQNPAQQVAQLVPEPLTPIQIPAAGVPAQLQNQPASNNTAAEIFAAQLTLTEAQGTVQVQEPANAPAANAAAAGAGPANTVALQFQELQLTFQAVEVQQTEQAAANPSGLDQGINLRV